MKLKEMAPNLNPKKLIRIEIDREEQEQHIFADIEFALKKLPELEIIKVEEMPWTYVLKGDPNTDVVYPSDDKAE